MHSMALLLQPLDIEEEPVFCPCLEALPERVRSRGLYRTFLQVRSCPRGIMSGLFRLCLTLTFTPD